MIVLTSLCSACGSDVNPPASLSQVEASCGSSPTVKINGGLQPGGSCVLGAPGFANNEAEVLTNFAINEFRVSITVNVDGSVLFISPIPCDKLELFYNKLHQQMSDISLIEVMPNFNISGSSG